MITPPQDVNKPVKLHISCDGMTFVSPVFRLGDRNSTIDCHMWFLEKVKPIVGPNSSSRSVEHLINA